MTALAKPLLTDNVFGYIVAADARFGQNVFLTYIPNQEIWDWRADPRQAHIFNGPTMALTVAEAAIQGTDYGKPKPIELLGRYV